MKKIVFLILVLTSYYSLSQPQAKIPEPVKWVFSYAISKENTMEITLFLTATIVRDWHIYSQNIALDGPVPSSFLFNPDSLNFILVGKTEEPISEKKFDDAFQIELAYYSNVVVFTQKIKRVSIASFSVTGKLEFMCCNNIQCMPPKLIPYQFIIPPR
jgi:thiol:disulfide interchange protein DsbD